MINADTAGWFIIGGQMFAMLASGFTFGVVWTMSLGRKGHRRG